MITPVSMPTASMIEVLLEICADQTPQEELDVPISKLDLDLHRHRLTRQQQLQQAQTAQPAQVHKTRGLGRAIKHPIDSPWETALDGYEEAYERVAPVTDFRVYARMRLLRLAGGWNKCSCGDCPRCEAQMLQEMIHMRVSLEGLTQPPQQKRLSVIKEYQLAYEIMRITMLQQRVHVPPADRPEHSRRIARLGTARKIQLAQIDHGSAITDIHTLYKNLTNGIIPRIIGL